MMSSNNQLEVDSSHFGNSWKVVPSCADVRQVNSGLSLVLLYFFSQIYNYIFCVWSYSS